VGGCAGRTGDISLLKGCVVILVFTAAGSSDAKKLWNNDKSYDAWLVWTIWHEREPRSADLIKYRKGETRSTGLQYSNDKSVNTQATAKEFIDFCNRFGKGDLQKVGCGR
jgi:accessory colonization factor AcfC